MKALKASIVRAAVAEGRSPEEDWMRIKKDVEIYDTLDQFRRAGVRFTYHACDISDWDALGKTLEVGAGCGYQAAVLAMLTRELYAVERIEPLLARARKNLGQLRLSHVRFKHADGHWGLPEAAPFDTIIVAAAAASTPPALLDQLAPGGRLILPLAGAAKGEQTLSLIERTASGYAETRYDVVRFVPLVAGVE